jgi:hypothetical protein
MSVTIVVDDRALKALIANTGGKVERIIADGVEYGVHQEWGTSKMSAQPFMSPAVEAVRPGFQSAFQNQLTDAQVEAVVVKGAFDIERGAKERAPVDTGALKSSIHVVEP